MANRKSSKTVNVEIENSPVAPELKVVSTGCQTCDNTGLQDADHECPVCHGSPFGVE